MSHWIVKATRRNSLSLDGWKAVATSLFILFSTVCGNAGADDLKITDANPLAMPPVGAHGLRIISPTVLELTLVTSKGAYPARVSAWDFVDDNFNASIPGASRFSVKANGNGVGVQTVGFKRRPLYAPEKRDLRLGNYIYLTLSSPIAEGQSVEVTNPDGSLWDGTVQYNTTMEPLRYSPAIHVNQVGYMPSYVKQAEVGYYLGSLGELPVPASNGFQIVDARSGAVVFSGSLTQRADRGFSYGPTPYQQVYQADFSAFQKIGEYKLVVPGLGASFPFRIDEGVAASFARTFAMGLYHQRCGMDNSLPYTRHTHEDCHVAPAQIPTMAPEFSAVQQFLKDVSSDYQHSAPQLKDVNSSLYPFVNQGKVDVSGGHHDAGDYSKYTINSAGLIHFMVFAADSFAGAGALDNMGIPESGDGKSDLLQEAKWEADYLAKMQDSDGGFYFLVYPKNRRYENNVLPEHGDSQVVWPKTTAVTAAAVAALAEAGSSPLMKRQFPQEAALYLEKARLGWTFLMNAISRWGKSGSYQKITHYGNEFSHDDELAWAAAAMFAATGEEQYQTKLFEFLPDPNSSSTWRWSWWRLFEGYGCAIRTYAFAARSGRLPASKLNASYLGKCEKEILLAADDHVRFSRLSAYGTSLPDTTKQFRSPGWYFSSERAFDVTVGYQIEKKPEYIEAVFANCNYEAGSNPLNMTYVTGIGLKRQQEVVSQYAWNDRRVLPPAGLPQGNVRQGYGYLQTYTRPSVSVVNGQPVTNMVNDLPYLSYPADGASTAPYPYYDRWTDMIDTMCEFVVMDQARSAASLAFWMAQSSIKSQEWKPVTGQIVGLNDEMQVGKATTVTLVAPGIDLSNAQVVWEARFLQPAVGNPLALTPKFSGDHWIEAEALLPDGRRIVAVSNFVASSSVDTPPNSHLSAPLAGSANMVALYHFDGDTTDAIGKSQAMQLEGKARLDKNNLAWMGQRFGGALRFTDLGDAATATIPISSLAPSGTTAITLEAMIYVNEYKAYDRDVATIVSLNESYNNSYVELREDKYMGPIVQGGNVFACGGGTLSKVLTTKQWHHLAISISSTGYSFKLDGQLIASTSSTELANWGHAPFANIVLGNFDGWIDEVVVRSDRAALPTLPGVTVSTPLTGSTVALGAAVPIAANLVNGSGTIQKVEYFLDSAKIGESTQAPYAISWTPAALGKFTITAKARTTTGLTGVSAPIGVTVSGTVGTTALLTPMGVTLNGGFRMQVTGKAGVKYKIQSSADSKTWTDIGTLSLNSDKGEFVDPEPASSYRLYRAVAMP